MTKQDFITRLDGLTPEQVERVLPFLEADVAAVDRLAELRDDIGRGRRSAHDAPLLDDTTAYTRARKSLP